MDDVYQIIIKNMEEKGIDVSLTDLPASRQSEISEYLSKELPSRFKEFYISKNLSIDKEMVILRYSLPDKPDKFGRESVKTHTLLINPALYSYESSLYFISPLLNKKELFQEDNLLTKEDFSIISPYPISSKLIEVIFTKKHIHFTSSKPILQKDLVHLFATLEWILPEPLRVDISFQTIVTATKNKKMRNLSFIYTKEEINSPIDLNEVLNSESEYDIFKKMMNNIEDKDLLNRARKDICLGRNIPRTLSVKIFLRFGIKKMNAIARNIDQYFPREE